MYIKHLIIFIDGYLSLQFKSDFHFQIQQLCFLIFNFQKACTLILQFKFNSNGKIHMDLIHLNLKSE